MPPSARGWLVRTVSQVRHYLFECTVFLMGFLALSAVVGVVAFGLEARVHNAKSPVMAAADNHEFARRVGALN
eukprot:766332-Pyramimonas_sp.AAC.1